jgi:hypothetical protein
MTEEKRQLETPTLSDQAGLPPASAPKKPINETALKLILAIFSLLTITGGAVYFGYRLAKQDKATPSPPTATPSLDNAARGDEFAEIDPDYQQAMREYTDQGPSGEESPWLTYTNETHQFSFQYPVTVFLEETEGTTLPLVYLDTKLIIVPPDYGSQLTPVEIRVPPLIEETTVEERVENMKVFFDEETYQEATPSAPLVGSRVSGTWQGFPFEGETFEEVILQGPRGLVIINFIGSDEFTKELFDKIIATFKFS